MKKTMFPREFVIWLIDDQEIFKGELCEKYITNDNPYKDGKPINTLDELYEYWLFNVKNKDNETD